MLQQHDHPQRAFLLSLFEKAVATAHPSVCVPPHLPAIPNNGRLIIVGAGKASAAMAVATEEHYASHGQLDQITGFITTRYGYELETRRIEILSAGHPVPDDGSIASAQRTLDAVNSAGENDIVLCLLSGGASALWSAPVDGVTLQEKQKITKDLLRSGARISEINCVRKHLSRIKGGQLAAAAAPAQLITLAISDVPGDDPDAIGSGPTVGDPTTLQDARDVLERYGLTPSQAIAAALANPDNETLKPGATALSRAQYKLIATPKAALEAAGQALKDAGYAIEVLGDNLEGEARDLGREQAERALRARKAGQRVAILSGGELTVSVRGNGRGGPNQEYALGLALTLNGEPGISALAGDTDGTDGGAGAADDPAGALVFPDTLDRAKAHDLNAANFLENNDSTGFFESIGDLILCGPTQTNINDFRVILVTPE